MANERKKWVDITRGFLILFVILGHSINNSILRGLLSSFYMPCFFILSGYVMHCNGLTWSLLWKSVKSILCPYLLFSILLIAMQATRAIIMYSDYSITQALISIVLPYSGRVGGSVYQLWFLPCLFIGQNVIQLLHGNNIQKIFGGVIWVTLFLIGIILPEGSLIIASAVAAVFIELGVVINRTKLKPSAVWIIIVGIVFVISNVVQIIILHRTVEFSSGTFGCIPIFIVSSITGSLLLINISVMLKQSVLLEFIGKNSLWYYGLHYLVLSVVGFIVARIIQYQIVAESLIFTFTLFGTSVLILIRMKWLQARKNGGNHR